MRALATAVLALATLAASAATTIQHKPIDTYVASKRIRLEATVSDPAGIKLARAYFKAATQADYLFVPMQAQLTSASTFVAVLPAPAPATTGLQYVFLAVNNANEVTKTEAFSARRTEGDLPSWQMVPGDGPVKVFTELAAPPSPATAFADSVSVDVAESAARFGAVAGLYGTQASSTAAATTATSGTTTTTATATASAAGGLGTGAVIGGIAIAGVAAAAGGGGGGSSGSTAPPTSPFAGSWSGTESATFPFTCTGVNGTVTHSRPWTASVDSLGNFLGSMGSSSTTISNLPGPMTEVTSLFYNLFSLRPPFAGAVQSNGTALLSLAWSQTATVSGGSGTVSCGNRNAQFSASPRSMTASEPCTITMSVPPVTCNLSWTYSLSGS